MSEEHLTAITEKLDHIKTKVDAVDTQLFTRGGVIDRVEKLEDVSKVVSDKLLVIETKAALFAVGVAAFISVLVPKLAKLFP